MDSPEEVLERVNDLLYAGTPSRMFVTCFYTIRDPWNGRLQYANAGQDLPFRQQAEVWRELRAWIMPLGLMPAMFYEEQEVILAPGEYILFYSDGLVKAHNRGSEIFGFPHIAFADRIGAWCMIRCFENLNRTCCRYTSEEGPKCAIVISCKRQETGLSYYSALFFTASPTSRLLRHSSPYLRYQLNVRILVGTS